MSDDETDRLLEALDVTSGDRDVDDARACNAVDRAVRGHERRMAGLEPHDAMDALNAMREAWERAQRPDQKAA